MKYFKSRPKHCSVEKFGETKYLKTVKCCCSGSNHFDGCGCMTPRFIRKARCNFFRALVECGTNSNAFATRLQILGEHHSRDEHEWDGGACDFHPIKVCNCGECKDSKLNCEGKPYVTKDALKCPFHQLAYAIECDRRALQAHEIIHPVLGKGHTNSVESSHGTLIKFRSKDMYLQRLHYITSTNMGLLQSSMTWLYKNRGPNYHWLLDLFERMKLPLFDGMAENLLAYNVRRAKLAEKLKTKVEKAKRSSQKNMHFSIEQKERRAWVDSQKMRHTYGKRDAKSKSVPKTNHKTKEKSNPKLNSGASVQYSNHSYPDCHLSQSSDCGSMISEDEDHMLGYYVGLDDNGLKCTCGNPICHTRECAQNPRNRLKLKRERGHNMSSIINDPQTIVPILKQNTDLRDDSDSVSLPKQRNPVIPNYNSICEDQRQEIITLPNSTDSALDSNYLSACLDPPKLQSNTGEHIGDLGSMQSPTFLLLSETIPIALPLEKEYNFRTTDITSKRHGSVTDPVTTPTRNGKRNACRTRPTGKKYKQCSQYDISLLFCKCRGVETENMVACDDPTCPIEWYHYECVGITAQPPEGKWYCSDCAKKQHDAINDHKIMELVESTVKETSISPNSSKHSRKTSDCIKNRKRSRSERHPAAKKLKLTVSDNDLDRREKGTECTCGALSRGVKYHKRDCPCNIGRAARDLMTEQLDVVSRKNNSDCKITSSERTEECIQVNKKTQGSDSNVVIKCKNADVSVGDYVYVHSIKESKFHLPCRIVELVGKRYRLCCNRGVIRTLYRWDELTSLATGCLISMQDWRQAPKISFRAALSIPEILEKCTCSVTKAEVTFVDAYSSDKPDETLELVNPVWMNSLFYKLFESDRQILESPEGWLNDRIIDAAQNLIANQFPHISGLQSVVLQQTRTFDIRRGPFVQILNMQNSHWIMISSIGCEDGQINVYDSMMYMSVSNLILRIISGMLYSPLESISINYMNVTQQTNSSDCGIYSIAYLCAVCSRQDPCQMLFNSKLIRGHLVKCLIESKVSDFPILRQRSGVNRIQKIQKVDLHCTCRMPFVQGEKEIVECKDCHYQFHKHCLNNPNIKVPWRCLNCTNK